MANEKRLIDANALIDDTYILNSWDAEIVRAWLADQPTVDAVEVVHGRWLKATHTLSTGSILAGYSCSECDNFSVRNLNYCPNCGAKMDGGNEDG